MNSLSRRGGSFGDGFAGHGSGAVTGGMAALREEAVPAQLAHLRAGALGEADGEVGHVGDGPLEILGGERVDVHVGGGVHEVYGVGDAVANGPLHRVHVVAEGTHEGEGVTHNATAERRGEVAMLDVVLALARVVFDG